jgi:hypothetical protein
MDRKTKNYCALCLVFFSTLIIWLLKNASSSSPNPTVDKNVKVTCGPPEEKSTPIYNTISIVVSIIALLISGAALRANYAEVRQMQVEVNEMALYNRLTGIPRVEFAIIRNPSQALPSYPIPGVYMVNYGPGLAILDKYRISFNNENITEVWDDKDWETVKEILGMSVLPNPQFISPSKYGSTEKRSRTRKLSAIG